MARAAGAVHRARSSTNQTDRKEAIMTTTVSGTSGAAAKITRAVQRPGGKADGCPTTQNPRETRTGQPAPHGRTITSSRPRPAGPLRKGLRGQHNTRDTNHPALPPQSIPTGPSRAAPTSGCSGRRSATLPTYLCRAPSRRSGRPRSEIPVARRDDRWSRPSREYRLAVPGRLENRRVDRAGSVVLRTAGS